MFSASFSAANKALEKKMVIVQKKKNIVQFNINTKKTAKYCWRFLEANKIQKIFSCLSAIKTSY